MTREEQIQKLIDKETGIDNYGSSDYQIGVCDGVRLADKTMLDNACKWFEPRLHARIGREDTEELITAFRQTMKEGTE